ncbi:MAG: hypothetical protein MR594_04760 [Lachnospiraceae bacterium]|nr:hypothetical protein [Lachnospiraceae bacterium]
MGRLIEEDKLMQDVNNTITEKSGAIDWINLINRQPTAYDPEKVVKQLEERSKEYNSGVRLHGKPEEMLTDDAIEIVKGGGAE